MKILYLIASMLVICLGIMCRNQRSVPLHGIETRKTLTVDGPIYSEGTYALAVDSTGNIIEVPRADTFTPKPLKIKMKPRWRDEGVSVDSVYNLMGLTSDMDLIYSTGTVGIPIDSGYLESWGKIGDRHYDTIHCVMLVSDSSIVNGFRSQRSYWIYGNCIQYYSDPFWGDYYSTIGYLDENKKPLPKNIIVWLSK